MSKFKIAKTDVYEGCKPLVIAEIGQNHDGSLGIAHAYIDAVADAGADIVKFQTHIADAESSRQDKFRVKFSYEDKNRYDYWRRMEFSEEQWLGLSKHAEERGLIFLSSPFSMEAALLLERIGCPAWKIGSGEVHNDIMLDFFQETGKPVLLSSGMSSHAEIDSAVQKIQEKKLPIAVFQCTSKYPTPYKDVGLNILDEFKSKYGIPVGLSDHSGKIFPALFAMNMGASLIEVHVTFNNAMFGPDVESSITLDELNILSKGAKAAFEINTNRVDKDRMAEELHGMKYLFEKSIATAENLSEGIILNQSMLKGLKPGSGIPVKDLDKVIGRTLNKDLTKNSIILWDDIS